MHKTYFFESGLPRSGSTLLSAILNQNPDLHCGAISPVLEIMYYTEQYFEGSEQALAYPKPEQHHKIISSVIDNYYSDREEKYIIDKCRAWPNNVDRAQEYITKTPKILCPVRDVLEILTSFVEMIHRNPNQKSFIDNRLIEKGYALTDNNRCDYLMSQDGIVDQSLYAFGEGFRKGCEKYMHIIEYNDLVNRPEETMRKIYKFLDIPHYSHDFNNVFHKYREKDNKIYGLSDMHEVRKEVRKTSKRPEEVLSDYILNKYSNMEFWRKAKQPISLFI
jgi:sulfotransferase